MFKVEGWGYGILAKDLEAECVDDLSIWTLKKNTFMPIVNDNCKKQTKLYSLLGSVIFLRIF